MSDTTVQGTSFDEIYTVFNSKITDDMYMELTQSDTEKLQKELLLRAIPFFEFPKQSLDVDTDIDEFVNELTNEEQNILATYMICAWIDQQLASVENTRMKYSGTDFKFTSQANHMQKLSQLKESFKQEGFHLQRLYKRRRPDSNGIMRSTMDLIMRPIPEVD